MCARVNAGGCVHDMHILMHACNLTHSRTDTYAISCAVLYVSADLPTLNAEMRMVGSCNHNKRIEYTLCQCISTTKAFLECMRTAHNIQEDACAYKDHAFRKWTLCERMFILPLFASTVSWNLSGLKMQNVMTNVSPHPVS